MSALATTLYELFGDNLETRPDHPAWIDPERTLAYSEAADVVDHIARALREVGVGRGDRVIVCLRKSNAEAAAIFAVAKLGAVVVDLHHRWTLDQLAYVAADCGARAMVVEPRTARLLARAPAGPGAPRVLVDGPAPEDPRFTALAQGGGSGAMAPAPCLDTDLAAIVYTSGSTGRPKGVMLSHRNILAGARSVARYLRLRPDDRLLSVLPYSFDAGLNQLTTMMLVGGTVAHEPVPIASEIVRSLARNAATGLAAVPPLWCQIVRYLDDSPVALPALRRVTNTGGRIPTPILERMPAVFPGVDIVLMYGLTEAFRSTYLPPERFAGKMGAIGRAIPGAEVYVVKHGVGIAGPNEEGELVHRGPLVSLGYWGRPDATREKIRPCPELAPLIGDEPVVYSGDTVRIDADGDLWFVGRTDGLIKTSGFRLSPDEVEDVVHRSGMVADAVAFGVDDDDLGQVVHLAVALLPGHSEAALAEHCARAMPPYMVPRRIHVFETAMPRTASGKLARPEVIRTCRAAHGPAADPSTEETAGALAPAG